MDRWYFSKPFLSQLASQQFDWVTKAKRNTQLFRRVIEPGTGRERVCTCTSQGSDSGSLSTANAAARCGGCLCRLREHLYENACEIGEPQGR